MSNDKSTHEARKKTCMNKYNVEHFSQTPEYKTKFAETCNARYGVSNPGQISNNLTSRSRKKQETYWKAVCDVLEKANIKVVHSFDEYTHIRDNELLWKCIKCDTEFTSSLFCKLPKCEICTPTPRIGGPSKIELEIVAEIRKIYQGEIIQNTRNIISPKEIDIFIPEHNFAIEVNGTYWHSSDKVGKNYHMLKRNACRDAGIHLMMITDVEWKEKKTLLLEMIAHRIQANTRPSISVRKCITKQVQYAEIKEFMNRYHLSGAAPGKAHYGLYFGNDLVAAITIGHDRFSKNKNAIELIRFATPYRAPGALGKLLKHCIANNQHIEHVISYVDYRYGNGKVYKENGFKWIKDTNPGYWYVIGNTLQHRLSWTKKKLVEMGHDKNLTENEIMRLNGIPRYYDCGHGIFKLEIN